MKNSVMRSGMVSAFILGIAVMECSGQQVEKITCPVQKDGMALQFPFAGGMDAPQFSQVDFNRDGLQDVFVFDRQGNTAIPFVTTFHEGVFDYEIQWEMLEHFPALQQWVLLLDFNSDGVEDVFASTDAPGVQGIDVYRGGVAGGKLTFEKMQFDLGDYDVLYFKLGTGFTPLYAAWIDIPAIRDIDGDGDVDVLSFEPGGSYLHYFKNLAVEDGLGIDTFLLDWEDVCWGKFYENAFSEQVELSGSPGQCATGSNDLDVQTRHSGSTTCAFDHDSDGDQDLLLGDLSSARIKLLINGGTADQAWITSEDNTFPSGDVPVDLPFFVAPFILDINHDDIDDVVAASNNTGFSENFDVAWYYRNDGISGQADFHLEERALFVSEMVDYGSEAKPAFFDYNADGLEDILIGTGGFYTPEGTRDARLILLKNIGTATEPAFEVTDEDYLGFSVYASVPTWEFAPTAGDLDKDGDVDLIIGERNGGLFYVENTADINMPAVFDIPVYPYANINIGTSSTPALIDLNGDGLLDIVCGERIGNNDNMGRCGNLNYFQNTGTPGNPQFISDPTQAPNTQCLGRVIFNTNPAIPEYSAPAFVRTPEGLRMVSGSETGIVRIYKDIENITAPFTLEDGDYGGISDGERIVPAMHDIDRDGFYEMILGNKRGGLTLYNTDIRIMTTATHNVGGSSPTLEIIPNPTGGNVRILADVSLGGVMIELEIYDLQGRCVSQGWHSAGDMITLSLQSGLYIAMLSTDYQHIAQRILVR